jgi:hypothetical protein
MEHSTEIFIQQDDERYPTLVEPSTLEVSGSPGSHPQTPPLQDVRKSHAFVPHQKCSGKELDGQVLSAPVDQVVASPKRILGLSKTTFWLVLAVAVLVIGGAVGGAVGGTLGRKSSGIPVVSSSSTAGSSTQSSITSSTTVPSTTTSSATSATTTAASRPVERIAVSSVSDDKSNIVMLAVYYQDTTNGSIMYTIWTAFTSWTELEVASLSVAPKNGTPLAATSFLVSSGDTPVR